MLQTMELNKFERLLLRNSSQIEQADRFLTYLTTFLPGQTPSMELISEALVSGSAILQTYKNQILNKITTDSEKSLESKYLDAEYSHSKQYKVLAYALSVLKSTELFVEMTSSRYKGEAGRWKAVILLESLKSALRLGMLNISQRPLPSIVPVHEVEADQEQVDRLLLLATNQTEANFEKKRSFDLQLQNRLDHLEAPDFDKMKPPIQLVRKLNPLMHLSEVVAILRPVIYASLLYKYRARRRSWMPWLVGFLAEFLARQLSSQALKNTPKRSLSKLEKQISTNRKQQMLWWLMRSRMYDDYTRKFLMGIVNLLLKLPVLNLGGRLLEDFLYLFDEYYFASATL